MIATMKRLRSLLQSRVLPEKTYSSHAEALRHCSGDAYLSVDIANVVAAKTRILVASLRDGHPVDVTPTSVLALTGILYILQRERLDKIRVIDFGGACGAHYFQVRAALPRTTSLQWAIVETPTMIAAGKELERDELRFFDTLESARAWLGAADLTHSSSALPYTPEPFAFLRQLLSLSSTYLLLTRMNMTEGNEDITFVQSSMLSWNGVGQMPPGFVDREVQYPNTAFRKTLFESMIAERYQALLRIDDPSSARRVAGETLVGFGIFARLK